MMDVCVSGAVQYQLGIAMEEKKKRKRKSDGITGE
jgi:hypothetical protein